MCGRPTPTLHPFLPYLVKTEPHDTNHSIGRRPLLPLKIRREISKSSVQLEISSDNIQQAGSCRKQLTTPKEKGL